MGSIGANRNYSRYAPSSYDVADPEHYFDGTSLEVNTSLTKWVDDADENEIPGFVYQYMADSSVNDDLRGDEPITPFVRKLDDFVKSSAVPKGTILYSGLNREALDFWDKPIGTKFRYKAFLSTSPDPLYARGYALNTNVMLQIETSKMTDIGKTYYESSAGTEGILGRNTAFEIVGKTTGTVDGQKVKIIKVRI